VVATQLTKYPVNLGTWVFLNRVSLNPVFISVYPGFTFAICMEGRRHVLKSAMATSGSQHYSGGPGVSNYVRNFDVKNY